MVQQKVFSRKWSICKTYPNLKLEDFAWKFNENGIFYCENVDSPPAEQSNFLKRQRDFFHSAVLHCAKMADSAAMLALMSAQA